MKVKMMVVAVEENHFLSLT